MARKEWSCFGRATPTSFDECAPWAQEVRPPNKAQYLTVKMYDAL